jgi:hypothetical protein
MTAGFADPAASAQDRIAAIGAAASDATGRDDVVRALLAVLADPADDPAVRRAAQAALGQLSFATAAFAPYETDYRVALRTAATDPDSELATHALESLTLRHDDYAQELVLAGLDDPARAVLSRPHALRLLGRDLHAAQFPMLRDIVANRQSDPPERIAALRLLGADSDAAPLFADLLADRSESSEVRVTSAVALHNLDPTAFAPIARDIVLDHTDDDEVRAVSLTTLAATPAGAAGGGRPGELADAVLTAPTPPSAELRRAVRQFRAANDVDADH